MKEKIHKIGRFYSGIIMGNMGLFIFAGFLSVLFQEQGWFPNEEIMDPYFKGILVVFIMLLPVDDNIKINSEILGYISTILIEDYTFMDTVLSGSREKIKDALSVHLKKFFGKYLARM